jgi:membrane-bound inhibitor of C-type lysozyme
VNVGANVQDFAVAVPAASGAKYQGKRLVFWTKGETATLTRGGAAVNCRQEP